MLTPLFRRLITLLPVSVILFFVYDTAVPALIPRLEVNLLAHPASIQFESGIQLLGYRIDNPHVRLYASAKLGDYIGLGYSIHLVDQTSGESVAGHDQYGFLHDNSPGSRYFKYIFRQQMELNIPPDAPTNHALWIVLTLWRKKGDEYVSKKVLQSDQQLLSETQVILGELVLPAEAAAPSHSAVGQV